MPLSGDSRSFEIRIILEERKLQWEFEKECADDQWTTPMQLSGLKLEWEQKNFITRLNPALIHINFGIS